MGGSRPGASRRTARSSSSRSGSEAGGGLSPRPAPVNVGCGATATASTERAATRPIVSVREPRARRDILSRRADRASFVFEFVGSKGRAPTPQASVPKGDTMLHRLLNRLTYANVVATLALFIALGGTSYAALKLPKNSVGSTQIKTGAVHTGEIANRTIRLGDINLSARSSLRGQTGPQGATGPAGPAGAPAVKHFAAVSASGGLLRGDAKSGGSGSAIGTYVVGFA